MQKTFIKALAWNSSATFIYKVVLLLHQIILYSVISKTLYGLQNTIFALIYTTIALTNFGFEETSLPFFSTFSKSKQQFYQFLIHYVWHSIITTILTMFLYITLLHGPGEFLHNIQLYCNKNIIFIISMIFFIESIKKSLISTMQLAFLNKEIAYAQISMLIKYISIVWILYGFFGQLTLHNIFIPMLTTSTLEVCYLLYHLIHFYRTLPNIPTPSNIPLKTILKQRAFNYINQIIKTIYSSNSMTIFFVYIVGFQQAATIKLFTNIITLCYTCISKTIGVTSGAALSTMNQMPLPVLQSFFKKITNKYFQTLAIFTGLLTVAISYTYYNEIISPAMALQIIIFFIISLCEHLNVTYEQLFISQHAANIIALINSSGLGLLIICGSIYYIYDFNPITLLYLYMIVKIISLAIITFIARQRWSISIK